MQIGGDSELTVSNDLIRFRDATEAKHSFTFPISELRSLERRHGPMGFLVLRLKLQNGKKFDLVPGAVGHGGYKDGKNFQKGLEEAADAMEKAIRDMASQHGIALK